MAKKPAPAPAESNPVNPAEPPGATPSDIAAVEGGLSPDTLARFRENEGLIPEDDEAEERRESVQRPAAKPAVTPKPAANAWLTDELVERAASFGFSRDEAASYSSADVLTKTLDRFAAAVLRAPAQQQQPAVSWSQWFQQANGQPTPQPVAAPVANPFPTWQAPPAPVPTPIAASVPPSPQVRQQPPAQVPGLFPLQIDESAKTDPLAQQLVAMNQHYGQQLAQLQAERNADKAAATARQFEQHMSWFDKKCQSPALVDVLGPGSLLAMNPASTEAQNRGKLLKTVEGLQHGFAQAGVRMTMDQVFAEAVRISFGTQLATAAAAKRPASNGQRPGSRRPNGQFVAPVKPSQSHGEPGFDEDTMARMEAISERTGVPVA